VQPTAGNQMLTPTAADAGVVWPTRAIRAALISMNILLHTACHDLVTAWNAARPSRDFYDFSTPLDRWIPYLGWSWIAYYFGDLYILLWGSFVVWNMPSRQFFWAVPVYSVMIIAGALTHFALPGYSPWPEQGSLVQHWFHEHITFDPNVCLPSMHVALTVLPTCMAYDVFHSRVVHILCTVAAVLITVSTVTLKEHFVLDALAGLLLGLLFYVVWKKASANEAGPV
jgi:hypothetical protein